MKEKICETAKKRMKIICENLNDERKQKLCKGDQKRKQFVAIWMIKSKRKYPKQLNKE